MASGSCNEKGFKNQFSIKNHINLMSAVATLLVEQNKKPKSALKLNLIPKALITIQLQFDNTLLNHYDLIA